MNLTPSVPVPPDWRIELEALLPELASGPCVYFPVRHHSPACAFHLQNLIEELKPEAILIEGPAQFTPLIPLILNPEARAPFAIYTQFIDKKRQLYPPPTHGPDFGPARFAAYYPFCDYSPELVALRAGAKAGSRLRFIDLNYAEQVIAEHSKEDQTPTPRMESLLREHHFQRSAYLRALAAATGCRDSNELWDHLFESQILGGTTEDFIRSTIAYCFFARKDTAPELMETDGTLLREAAMADAIINELDAVGDRSRRGCVIAVTGGFHSVVLPGLVQSRPNRPKPGVQEETGSHLIRYGFEQLDALNGYASGMPSPFYYQALWDEIKGSGKAAYAKVAAELIVEVGSLTRRKQLQIAVSTADEIAALQHAHLLSLMRGHPGPLREDLLDGVRSCFVKGALDAEGELVLGVASHILTGTRIGSIPPEAGECPIVTHFRERARRLRLNLEDTVRRKVSLEIYRKRNHREASRFLHSLEFLGIPFGMLEGGPDFVRGTQLHLLWEHWQYAWSPSTEAALVNNSIYGASVEEAALNRLREAIARLDEQAMGRSAKEAIQMLVRACRMGLQRHTSDLLEQLAARLGEDPSFASTASAAMQLLLLWQSREPLEAHDLKEIPVLIQAAYHRCCYLTPGLSRCSGAEIPSVLEALLHIRGLLASGHDELLDPMIFWNAVDSTWNRQETPPPIAGGICGLLRSANRISEDELGRITAGHIGGSSCDWKMKVGFVQGVLATCREAAWQNRFFLEAVDLLLSDCDESSFLQALPELRLAFANLTPREADKTGALVATIHGKVDFGSTMHFDLSESDLEQSRRMSQAVLASLEYDGLEDFISGEEGSLL